MSVNKYRNSFLQFVLIMALCLCYVLISPGIFLAHAATLSYYVVESYRQPSVIYRIEGSKSKPIFTYGSGHIKSIAVWDGGLYFSLVDGNVIYKTAGPGAANPHFSRQGGKIQSIAFDSKGTLYFSEVSNAVVIIYSVASDRANFQERHRIPLNSVNGGAENFRFDMKGKLYLSSGGKRVPAYIYNVDGNSFPVLYSGDDKGFIRGIALEPFNTNFIYYANGESIIYKVNRQNNERTPAFSTPPGEKFEFSDVAFDMKVAPR